MKICTHWLALFALCVMLLSMAGLPAAAQTLAAQTAPPTVQTAPVESSEVEPAQDILIEGLGFSKLILQLQVDPQLGRQREFARILALLEKNICWSGLFNLWSSSTRHCRLRFEPPRIDMRLVLSLGPDGLQLRLHDSGPESLLLFHDVLRLEPLTQEGEAIDVANRLTQRVTGQAGVLGTSIAFAMRQSGFQKVIVATSTHGERLRLLSNNSDINVLPRFSSTGNGIIYTVLGRKGTRLYYQNLFPNDPAMIQSKYITRTGSLNTGGTFSPDGENVVVTMSVNRNADLYLVDLRTRKRRQVTSRLGIETQADWSPRHNQLVFVSDRTGTPQVYVMDLNTEEELRLTFDGVYNADPQWSPDGESILFTKRVDGTDQIHIMDKFGENVRPVTRGLYDAEQAVWSPDGRQIAFASNRTREFKLYIVSTDGSNLRRLTTTAAGIDENSPSWTLRRIVR